MRNTCFLVISALILNPSYAIHATADPVAPISSTTEEFPHWASSTSEVAPPEPTFVGVNFAGPEFNAGQVTAYTFYSSAGCNTSSVYTFLATYNSVPSCETNSVCSSQMTAALRENLTRSMDMMYNITANRFYTTTCVIEASNYLPPGNQFLKIYRYSSTDSKCRTSAFIGASVYQLNYCYSPAYYGQSSYKYVLNLDGSVSQNLYQDLNCATIQQNIQVDSSLLGSCVIDKIWVISPTATAASVTSSSTTTTSTSSTLPTTGSAIIAYIYDSPFCNASAVFVDVSSTNFTTCVSNLNCTYLNSSGIPNVSIGSYYFQQWLQKGFYYSTNCVQEASLILKNISNQYIIQATMNPSSCSAVPQVYEISAYLWKYCYPAGVGFTKFWGNTDGSVTNGIFSDDKCSVNLMKQTSFSGCMLGILNFFTTPAVSGSLSAMSQLALAGVFAFFSLVM